MPRCSQRPVGARRARVARSLDAGRHGGIADANLARLATSVEAVELLVLSEDDLRRQALPALRPEARGQVRSHLRRSGGGLWVALEPLHQLIGEDRGTREPAGPAGRSQQAHYAVMHVVRVESPVSEGAGTVCLEASGVVRRPEEISHNCDNGSGPSATDKPVLLNCLARAVVCTCLGLVPGAALRCRLSLWGLGEAHLGSAGGAERVKLVLLPLCCVVPALPAGRRGACGFKRFGGA